jgi:prepilin-type N-terminal cleavage/methylation domain-containing protein
MMKKRHAFTLIELLCVVATIAILAAIAVPNFLHAQIRSKIARTKSDLAILQAGLHAYYADHNRYPPNNPVIHSVIRGTFEAALEPTPVPSPTATPTPIPAPRSAYSYDYDYDSGSRRHPWPSRDEQKARAMLNSGYDLAVLTTPIPYFCGVLPRDVFFSRYASTGRSDWTSAVPSIAYFNLIDDFPDYSVREGNLSVRYLLFSHGPDTKSPIPFDPLLAPWVQHDPTNGTTSGGDLMEFGNE